VVPGSETDETSTGTSAVPMPWLDYGARVPVDAVVLASAAGEPPAEVDAQSYGASWLTHHGLERSGGMAGLTPRYAVQAALILTVAATLVAAVVRPLYGLITLALFSAGTVVLQVGFGRWAALAARVRLPRGRLLGVVAMLPPLIVSLAVMAVLRGHYRAGADRAAALGLMRQAQAAADGGYTDHAYSLLQQAETIDADVPGVKTLQARLAAQRGPDRELVILKRRIERAEAGSGGAP